MADTLNAYIQSLAKQETSFVPRRARPVFSSSHLSSTHQLLTEWNSLAMFCLSWYKMMLASYCCVDKEKR